MKHKFIVSFAVAQLISLSILAQVKEDDIVGVWLTPGKEPAKIQIFKSGEKYFGKIMWLKYPEENGKPKLDNNNPDKTKRSNQVIGLVILKGFQFDGDDEWEDGKFMTRKTAKHIAAIFH